jgi:hypothetical protein
LSGRCTVTSDFVVYASGVPRRLGLSYETTAVNVIDLAAAKRLQAAFKMSIALGSRVKSGEGTGGGLGVLAAFAAFAGFLAFDDDSWAPAFVMARNTVSVNNSIQQ